ncbi:MAG: carbohydrate kinase family protein [Gemmataceae bacterium]
MTAPVVVGTGRLTLDVLVRDGEPRELARAQSGGTCGNVLTNLAYLGWAAYPLADVGDDDPGRRYRRDLDCWGVRLDLVQSYPEQATPVIIHHLRGGHEFSSRCPFCGHTLQYYEPVPLERVEARLPRVPRADVYFFDRDSPGSLRLARHCRERGALVVYEPNYAGPDSQLDEALAVADVLKFSHDKLGGLAETRSLAGPRLVIETLGGEGLRFLDTRVGRWEHQPAFRVPVVRDAGGSGDWCTAGFLHRHWQGDDFGEALRFGQALAAWNCAFEGARGGLYRVGRKTMMRHVLQLATGEVFDPMEGAGPSTLDEAGAFCPVCRGDRVAEWPGGG